MTLSSPKPLTDGHVLEDFRCGNVALDEWLVRRARANDLGGASRTFVVAERGTNAVVAYYSLASGNILGSQVSGRFRRNMPDPIPIILLGRLAIDLRYQGRGLGRNLIGDALRRVEHAAESVGIRGVIVHAISSATRDFYLAVGFEPTRQDPMMLAALISDLQKLRAD